MGTLETISRRSNWKPKIARNEVCRRSILPHVDRACHRSRVSASLRSGPAPDRHQTGEALRVLQATRQPVIVAGGGVRASGAGAKLMQCAEALNIPVAAPLNGMLDIKAPTRSYLRSAGRLGWAFPAALGVKCGVPDRPVVCFTGDAGFWYHIGDLETAVRFGISTVTIVNNNGSGNQSKRGFDRFYETAQTDFGRSLWTFREVNFAKIAEVIGATGIRVEKPRDIAPAIEKALRCKGPVAIDVVTDRVALAPLAIV